jgi:hypothetical protein
MGRRDRNPWRFTRSTGSAFNPRGRLLREEYEPFYSFAHETTRVGRMDVGPSTRRGCAELLGRGPRQGLDVYLSFVSGGGTRP